MGVLFAFAVGWLLGARGGQQGYDEVVDAAKTVLRSDEFTLLKDAVRRHAGFTLQRAAEWLQPERGTTGGFDDVVARVRLLVQRPEAGTSE